MGCQFFWLKLPNNKAVAKIVGAKIKYHKNIIQQFPINRLWMWCPARTSGLPVEYGHQMQVYMMEHTTFIFILSLIHSNSMERSTWLVRGSRAGSVTWTC